MAVNVALLKKIRKVILEEPKRLDMAQWGLNGRLVKMRPEKNRPACGTVACLAGWTVIVGNSKQKRSWKKVFDGFERLDAVHDVPEEAAKLLRIPKDKCPFYKWWFDVTDVVRWIDDRIAQAEAK